MKLSEYQKLAARTIVCTDPLDMARHACFGLLAEIQRLENSVKEKEQQYLTREFYAGTIKCLSINNIIAGVGNIWWLISELATACGVVLNDDEMEQLWYEIHSSLRDPADFRACIADLKNFACGVLAGYLQRTYEDYDFISSSDAKRIIPCLAVLVTYATEGLFGYSLDKVLDMSVKNLEPDCHHCFSQRSKRNESEGISKNSG